MCYSVPIVTSAVTTVLWARNKSPRMLQLNLMLYGASIFGFVDHLWNGELFLISDNIAKDLLLGVTITAMVFVAWGLGAKAMRKAAA